MITLDQRRNSHFFLRRSNYTFCATGALKRQNNELPERDKKTIVFAPERFLNDGLVDKSAVLSKFHRLSVSLFCRFIVSLSCDRDRKKTSKLQVFEFQTRQVTIATIAMATRPIHLSARSRFDTSDNIWMRGQGLTKRPFA